MPCKPSLILVGGKGGVGKTTTAAASALRLAKSNAGERYLLISTDPAHSLRDAFEVELDNTPRALQAFPNLFVRELDAERLLEDFKVTHHNELRLLGERGTYFDTQDIESFLDLSFPGVDEVMALLEISHLIENRNFACLIVDTAPTGHTLSLLRLPAVLEAWCDVFELMQEKHHSLQRHFAGKIVFDSVDRFLNVLRQELIGIGDLLRNPAKTEFIMVISPEPMILEETLRYVDTLKKQRIGHLQLVINGLNRVDPLQADVLARIATTLGSIKKTYVPLADEPIQGTLQLEWFSNCLASEKLPEIINLNTCSTGRVCAMTVSVNLMELGEGEPEIWIVGGKGGVGKTTVVSATAIRLSLDYPRRNFLLFSIDPAHSLSDCFKIKIGGHETEVSRNLKAIEVDSGQLLIQFRNDYVRAIDKIFDRFVASNSDNMRFDLGFDRKLLNNLLEMTPPGMDELMALYQVMQLRDGKRYDTIIFDTAPTGHLLRFLEFPKIMSQWLQAVFRLLLKYKSVITLSEAAEKLVELSKHIRQMREVLENPEKTRMIVVTNPEPMVMAETKRLTEKLKDLHLDVSLVVINKIRPAREASFALTSCRKLSSRMKAEIPLLKTDIRGIEGLTAFASHLYH